MELNRLSDVDRYVAFKMKDNSMAPNIQEGDEIIIDVITPAQNGDLVVIRLGDGGTVLRKMQVLKGNAGYVFTPINARQYEPIMSKRPLIIGRAVRLYRKIHTEPFISEKSNIAGQIPLFDARPALYLEREGVQNG